MRSSWNWSEPRVWERRGRRERRVREKGGGERGTEKGKEETKGGRRKRVSTFPSLSPPPSSHHRSHDLNSPRPLGIVPLKANIPILLLHYPVLVHSRAQRLNNLNPPQLRNLVSHALPNLNPLSRRRLQSVPEVNVSSGSLQLQVPFQLGDYRTAGGTFRVEEVLA